MKAGAPERVTSAIVGRFVFVPYSLVDEVDGCYGLEAAGPTRVSRTIGRWDAEARHELGLAE